MSPAFFIRHGRNLYQDVAGLFEHGISRIMASTMEDFSAFSREHTFALKLVPFLSMLGWLWLSYILIRRIPGSPTVCRCVILLTAASPAVVYFSVTLLSEMTFACLLSAALLLLTRRRPRTILPSYPRLRDMA